ncbi:MAG: SseB family protein [Hominimerdicola sp.]
MAEQNNNVKEHNEELVAAIEAMRKDFKPETQNKVINLALRATFIVPALIETNTELVADESNHVQFQDKQKAKFIIVNHKERGSFFPVFTDPEEAAKLKTEQPHQTFAMKFADIATLTEKTPSVNGFVINPFHQNLPFTKEMLESIKQTLIKAKKAQEEKLAQTADKPDITVSNNEE